LYVFVFLLVIITYFLKIFIRPRCCLPEGIFPRIAWSSTDQSKRLRRVLLHVGGNLLLYQHTLLFYTSLSGF
jgi:hypothetical protein